MDEGKSLCARYSVSEILPWDSIGAGTGMTVGSESGELTAEMPDNKELREERRVVAALREQLAAALGAKEEVEARLRESEELFQTRGAELARYQAELEAANDRLRGLVVTDDLTGLRNRRAFEERLAFEFSMARRKRRDLTVVLIDADDFKGVNDRLGHLAGDSVLQQLARVLQATVRLTDLAVRYGGEEFAAILPENDEPSALLWCARLQKALAGAVWEHGPLTVSMGAAGLTPACVDGSHLVAMADQALYRAKRTGKDRFVGARDLGIERAK
jgi:diguanylate cyclase (GGDEF)-like protein